MQNGKHVTLLYQSLQDSFTENRKKVVSSFFGSWKSGGAASMPKLAPMLKKNAGPPPKPGKRAL
ncbi:hypothetical protein KIY57_17445 [Heyndrickxia coagulans]|nr:hypothetical protein KIY57_17445 [Heyndrickxia coagulans]